MHNIITTENILLIGALLLFVAVMAGKAAYRFGAPALLFFLGVGMLFGINFISFHSVEATQFVGMIALCIILSRAVWIPSFGNTTGDRTGYRTGDRRSRHDGGDRSGFRHAHCPMGRAGRIVSCGAAAGRDDVFDGFGFVSPSCEARNRG